MVTATVGEDTFQFTPLREGRHKVKSGTTAPTAFQFTPLREGRHIFGLIPKEEWLISIHAPPRGATGDCFRRCPLLLISIHAPPRGATAQRSVPTATTLYFNSRPSARGDGFPHHVRCAGHISIHAPPRGATTLWQTCVGNHVISIHAPPRGATRWLYTQPSFSRYFNSRPSARGDILPVARTSFFATISIHAPPRGATHQRQKYRWRGYYFNSRPSARGDAQLIVRSKQRRYFNSRPSARGDSEQTAVKTAD